MIVGQGPIAFAVGAGGGCLDIFSLSYLFPFLSPSLREMARHRQKYFLEGPLIPNQPTNQLSKRGRSKREILDERKYVQTTPTRIYCKRSRPCPTIIQLVGRPDTGHGTLPAPSHNPTTPQNQGSEGPKA